MQKIIIFNNYCPLKAWFTIYIEVIKNNNYDYDEDEDKGDISIKEL